MTVLDVGHKYILHDLDLSIVEPYQQLRFVKRMGPGYPGNTGKAYPGINIQDVCRVLINRLVYLNWQNRHWVNPICIECLRVVINLLELRAAKRHHRRFKWRHKVELLPFDFGDGHIRYE